MSGPFTPEHQSVPCRYAEPGSRIYWMFVTELVLETLTSLEQCF